LLLVDVLSKGLTGKQAEKALKKRWHDGEQKHHSLCEFSYEDEQPTVPNP
jgi:hypothetical protein